MRGLAYLIGLLSPMHSVVHRCLDLHLKHHHQMFKLYFALKDEDGRLFLQLSACMAIGRVVLAARACATCGR